MVGSSEHHKYNDEEMWKMWPYLILRRHNLINLKVPRMSRPLRLSCATLWYAPRHAMKEYMSVAQLHAGATSWEGQKS